MMQYNNVNNFGYGITAKNIPAEFKLDIQKGDELIIHNNLPYSSEGNNNLGSLYKYRFILCMHMMKDLPKSIDASDSLSIQYSFLGQKNRV
jgi:hypothetical protein